jgi:hypothetical protein
MQLAGKWAAKYGLNPYIVAAVCEQESGWNPYVHYVHYVPDPHDVIIVPKPGTGTAS